jgi:hypothetical protein
MTAFENSEQLAGIRETRERGQFLLLHFVSMRGSKRAQAR